MNALALRRGFCRGWFLASLALLAPTIAFATTLPARPMGHPQNNWLRAGLPPTLFVNDATHNVVDIYNAQLQQTGQIAPGGFLAADANANLYVANGQTILVYGPGQTSPKLTLTIPAPPSSGVMMGPLAVSLTGEVAEAWYTLPTGNSMLSLFHPGQTSPFFTFSCFPFDLGSVGYSSIAWDGVGDIYLDGYGDPSGPPGYYQILRVIKGTAQCEDTGIYDNPYTSAALSVDSANNLIADYAGNNISVYPNGKPPASGSVSTPGTSAWGLVFAHTGTALWYTSGSSGVQEIAYPSGTPLHNLTISGSRITSIAVTPWAKP